MVHYQPCVPAPLSLDRSDFHRVSTTLKPIGRARRVPLEHPLIRRRIRDPQCTWSVRTGCTSPSSRCRARVSLLPRAVHRSARGIVCPRRARKESLTMLDLHKAEGPARNIIDVECPPSPARDAARDAIRDAVREAKAGRSELTFGARPSSSGRGRRRTADGPAPRRAVCLRHAHASHRARTR